MYFLTFVSIRMIGTNVQISGHLLEMQLVWGFQVKLRLRKLSDESSLSESLDEDGRTHSIRKRPCVGIRNTAVNTVSS